MSSEPAVDLADLKARMLARPEVRAEYEAQAPEFDLARELIAARSRAVVRLTPAASGKEQ